MRSFDLHSKATQGQILSSGLRVVEKEDSEQQENSLTRVVLADDHDRVRKGLRTLLSRTPDIEVVGEASDGQQALELVLDLKPDVLLLDMEMPRLNGNQVAARLRELDSPVRILALSAHDDRQYILGMLNNGASGYLTKEEAPTVLVKAVRGVARGEQGWVSQRIAKKIASMVPREHRDSKTLTAREIELLKLLKQKKSDEEISSILGIKPEVVTRQVKILSSKFQAQSRLELVVQASQFNWD